MAYKFSVLPDEYFRVVHLSPGEGRVYVEVSIEQFNPQTPKYDALSWQWGSQGDSGGHTISIRNKNDTVQGQDFKQMSVRPNLLQALERLRQFSPPFCSLRLWVDFICIDQSQPKEKAKQVAKMADIYRGAQKVHVWLGTPGFGEYSSAPDDFTDEELETAVQTIEALNDLEDPNHIGNVDLGISNKASLHNLEPLFKLLKRGWFSRRWIVQEIGVAKEAVVHCGSKHFEWKKLTTAVSLLERIGRDGSIDRLFKLRPDTRHVSEYVGNISALPAYRLVQNVSGLYRQISDEQSTEQYSLEQLVCFLVIFQASDPRDVIYAVLGIASDVKPSPNRELGLGVLEGNDSDEKSIFPVEYGQHQNPLKVYTCFLKYAIKRSESLDILCRPWAPVTKDYPLPSWILGLDRKPFQRTSKGKMVRFNPDPFVGPAVRKTGFYTASCGTSRRREDNWFTIKIGSDVLTVKAFELAKPIEIWDLAVHGSIPASWLKGVGWNEEKEPPEELWRTLVADRTSSGLAPEPVYSSIIQAAVREKGVNYGINTNEFLREKDNAAYFEVFGRVQAVVWNRKLIRTEVLHGPHEGETPLGLVPADTRMGDSIYIVDGCSVPLILRGNEAENSQQAENSQLAENSQQAETETVYYTLVGACYVNNMMDGRAMDGIRIDGTGIGGHPGFTEFNIK